MGTPSESNIQACRVAANVGPIAYSMLDRISRHGRSHGKEPIGLCLGGELMFGSTPRHGRGPCKVPSGFRPCGEPMNPRHSCQSGNVLMAALCAILAAWRVERPWIAVYTRVFMHTPCTVRTYLKILIEQTPREQATLCARFCCAYRSGTHSVPIS